MSSDSEARTYCRYTEYRTGDQYDDLPATGEGATGLNADVWEALYGVEDPEMPISIVDLGLIYGVSIEEEAETTAVVEMTLTYSGCPARDMLLGNVEEAVEAVDGIDHCAVRLVWSPEWSVDMVTDAGEDDLREFGLSI